MEGYTQRLARLDQFGLKLQSGMEKSDRSLGADDFSAESQNKPDLFLASQLKSSASSCVLSGIDD